MHMYTTTSNARAAARKLVSKYPTLIIDSHPQRAPGLTPVFYATVTMLPGAEPDEAAKADIEAKAKVLTADEHDEAVREDEESAAAHAASQKKGAKKPASPKAKKPAKPAKPAKAAKREGKGAKALSMMQRPEGATSEELQKALGWLPHTVRGFVSNENRLNGRGIETVRKQGEPSRYVLKT